MYFSDYGYAAYPKAWSTSLYNDYGTQNIKENNWLYINYTQLVISRASYQGNYIGALTGSNNPYNFGKVSDGGYTIRPTFYLKPTIKLASGMGTKDNPYRLLLN